MFRWLGIAPLGAAFIALPKREDGVWFENPEILDSQITALPYNFRTNLDLYIDEYNDLLVNHPKVLR